MKKTELLKLKNIVTEHNLPFVFPEDLSIFSEKEWPLFIYYNDSISGTRYPIQVPFECIQYVSEMGKKNLDYLDLLEPYTNEDIWLSENSVDNVLITQETLEQFINFFPKEKIIKQDVPDGLKAEAISPKKKQRKSPIKSPFQDKRDKIVAAFLRGIFEDLQKIKNNNLHKEIPELVAILNDLNSPKVEYLINKDSAVSYIYNKIIKTNEGNDLEHGVGKDAIEKLVQGYLYAFRIDNPLIFKKNKKE